jgi:hypothetical protein
MDCVICREAMIVLELDQVEIDYCLSCGGIWLDSGELGILLDDPHQVQEFLDHPLAVNGVRQTEKQCPECEKQMNELLVDQSSGLYIDRCPDKHGLWFDRGELSQVISLFKTDQSRKVAELLGKLFPDSL